MQLLLLVARDNVRIRIFVGSSSHRQFNQNLLLTLQRRRLCDVKQCRHENCRGRCRRRRGSVHRKDRARVKQCSVSSFWSRICRLLWDCGFKRCRSLLDQFIRRIRGFRNAEFRLICRTICRRRRVIMDGRNGGASGRATSDDGRYFMSATKGWYGVGVSTSNIHRFMRYTRRAYRHARRSRRQNATKGNHRCDRPFFRFHGFGIARVFGDNLCVISQASRATSAFLGRANQEDIRHPTVIGNYFSLAAVGVIFSAFRGREIFFSHLTGRVVAFRRSMGTSCKRRARRGRGPAALSDRVGRVRFKDICLHRCKINNDRQIDRVRDPLNWRSRYVRRHERFLCS